jgi:hypothetical protein
MFLFAVLLLAASSRVEISTDEICDVPAGEWRYREVELHQVPARISATYEVRSGSPRVRLALVRSEDLDRMRDKIPHGIIELTPPGMSGTFVDRFKRHGDFAVVIDNQDGHQNAQVHLRIWKDFGPGQEPEVSVLSPARQITVISISLAAFCGIAIFSGRRLLRMAKQ